MSDKTLIEIMTAEKDAASIVILPDLLADQGASQDAVDRARQVANLFLITRHSLDHPKKVTMDLGGGTEVRAYRAGKKLDKVQVRLYHNGWKILTVGQKVTTGSTVCTVNRIVKNLADLSPSDQRANLAKAALARVVWSRASFAGDAR